MFVKKIFGLGVLISLLLLSGVVLNAQNKEDEVIKVNTALVNIPVIVSDRQGRNIAGLQTQNFTVFEDGKQQKIEYFASQESPISVALLLDTSRSTQEVLGKIKKAAKGFVKQLQPSDRCLIVSFDNDVEILSELTSDHKTLEKAIKNAEIGERFGTVMQDAVYNVVNKQLAKVKGRKAIIMLTDGKDFGSNTTKSDLLYRLEESDTLIYSVFYNTGNIPRRFGNNRIQFPNRRNRTGGPRPRQNPFPDNFPRPNIENARQRNQKANEEAIAFLEQMANATAGRLYQKDVTDLDETFKLIADELRKQYLIGYYPEISEAKKTTHHIKVRVDKTDAVVRAKNSYRSKEISEIEK